MPTVGMIGDQVVNPALDRTRTPGPNETVSIHRLQQYAEHLLVSSSAIDAKTVAATSIFTIPAGFSCAILKAVIRCTSGSDLVAGPTLNLGSNAADYNNLLSALNVGGLTLVGNIFPSAVDRASVPAFPAGTAIFVNITGGANATTMNIVIELFGYLIP